MEDQSLPQAATCPTEYEVGRVVRVGHEHPAERHRFETYAEFDAWLTERAFMEIPRDDIWKIDPGEDNQLGVLVAIREGALVWVGESFADA